jgi:hypothetical protein
MNSEEYLGIQNDKLNSIDLYKLNKRDYVLYKRVLINKEDAKDGFGLLHGFQFINEDTIFIFGHKLHKIGIVSTEGDVLSIKKIKDISLVGGYLGVNECQPIYINSKLYVGVAAYSDPLTDKTYFEAKNQLEVEIDIKNNYAAKTKPISYPKSYLGEKWGLMYCFFSRTINKNGEFVYSFPIESNLIVSDLQSSKSIPASSKKQIRPYNEKEDLRKYALETPHYGQILYDKYRDIYYRFVYEAYQGEMVEKAYFYKPCNIEVFSNTFKLISRFDLPKEAMPNECFVSSKGLCIALNAPRSKNLSEEYVKFLVLTLN